jgi:hypothetical protein
MPLAKLDATPATFKGTREIAHVGDLYRSVYVRKLTYGIAGNVAVENLATKLELLVVAVKFHNLLR